MSEIGIGITALLQMGDVLAPGAKINLDKALTVQHFSYACSKRRTAAGNPYGPTMPSFLEFTVRLGKKDDAKEFFEQMHQPETFQYSFLFYSKSGTGAVEENSIIVASGYTVGLEESTRTVTIIEQVTDKDGKKTEVPKDDEQLHLTVKVMLSNLVIKSKDSKNLNLIITND